MGVRVVKLAKEGQARDLELRGSPRLGLVGVGWAFGDLELAYGVILDRFGYSGLRR